MKKIKKIGIVALLIAFLGACSKEDNVPFLKRDTDHLSFAFKESIQTFTVRTNGKWTIDLSEANWVSVDKSEGEGNGVDVEVISVTASRNIGEVREGVIKIKSADKEALIKVNQAEGSVVFGSASFTEPFIPGVELNNAFLVLPYEKGGIAEVVSVSCQVSGSGVGSLQTSNVDVNMELEKGTIRIPVKGTPGLEGELDFMIEILGQTIIVKTFVKEQGNSDPIGTIYLTQNFDLLTLGGDHVANAKGIRLKGEWAKLDGKNVLPENPVYEDTPSGNTDGTGDYFNTMHPSYLVMRGLAGWTGLRVYERPGYVKLGVTNDPGYLTTPKLSNIQGMTDVKVKFSAARWSENVTADAGATIIVSILNAGTSDEADKEIKLTPVWEDKEIIIEKATSETMIQFKTRTVANSRILLDNIEVSKVIK